MFWVVSHSSTLFMHVFIFFRHVQFVVAQMLMPVIVALITIVTIIQARVRKDGIPMLP
jgi:hypothetical protein